MQKLFFPLLILIFLNSCKGTQPASEKKIDDYVFKNQKERSAYLQSYNAALQLWQVPFQEDDIITSYGTAHVIIAGPENGQPLVLLHGMDASSTMWFPNIRAFASKYRVYAIDFLMEPGKSISCGESLNKEEIASWYREIFRHYHLEHIDIVAASRGGYYASYLAMQPDSPIQKLVLLSPAQTFEMIDQKNKAIPALLLKFFPNRNKLEKTLHAFSLYPDRINPVYKEQFYLANKYSKSNTSFIQMTPFSDAELGQITCPTLVLIGDHDIVNSATGIARAQRLIPTVETNTITDAGHFLTIDQAEIINTRVLEFLNRKNTTAPKKKLKI